MVKPPKAAQRYKNGGDPLQNQMWRVWRGFARRLAERLFLKSVKLSYGARNPGNFAKPKKKRKREYVKSVLTFWFNHLNIKDRDTYEMSSR